MPPTPQQFLTATMTSVAVGIVGDALLEIRCVIDDRHRGEDGVGQVVIGVVVGAIGGKKFPTGDRMELRRRSNEAAPFSCSRHNNLLHKYFTVSNCDCE